MVSSIYQWRMAQDDEYVYHRSIDLRIHRVWDIECGAVEWSGGWVRGLLLEGGVHALYQVCQLGVDIRQCLGTHLKSAIRLICSREMKL